MDKKENELQNQDTKQEKDSFQESIHLETSNHEEEINRAKKRKKILRKKKSEKYFYRISNICSLYIYDYRCCWWKICLK